jgi:hypothetical protein
LDQESVQAWDRELAEALGEASALVLIPPSEEVLAASLVEESALVSVVASDQE